MTKDREILEIFASSLHIVHGLSIDPFSKLELYDGHARALKLVVSNPPGPALDKLLDEMKASQEKYLSAIGKRKKP